MDVEELEDRIASFPRWHYRFEFDGGVKTPIGDRGQLNRHEQRRRYFFEALLKLAGGSLRGHRVLDLGCNAGFWSLRAIESGAELVVGIDVREMYIEQAKLVFEAKGVDRARYRFEQGDVFEHDLGAGFDVVLCLGLMEQVARPVDLFARMVAAGAEIVVLDTAISPARSSSFELTTFSGPAPERARQVALLPTRAAVVELAAAFGFGAVALAAQIGDWAGMDDYRAGRRLAFMCASSAPLDGLAVARRPGIASALAARLGSRGR